MPGLHSLSDAFPTPPALALKDGEPLHLSPRSFLFHPVCQGPDCAFRHNEHAKRNRKTCTTWAQGGKCSPRAKRAYKACNKGPEPSTCLASDSSLRMLLSLHFCVRIVYLLYFGG